MSTSTPEVVLEYLRALVWPAVVVLALILFRTQIADLLGRLRELSAAGTSAKFGEKVIELADTAAKVAEAVPGRPAAVMAEAAETEPVVDPTLAFLSAYRELESAARDAGPTAGVVAPLPVPVFRGLVEKRMVPPQAEEVARELRAIRNQVAHGERRLEAGDAESLAATARSLAAVCLAAIDGGGRQGPNENE